MAIRAMTIAILSDIHGNIAALDAVLADIAARGVTRIVNLGDILSGPLFPGETADRLMAMNLPTIAGNHERQLLTGAAMASGLCPTAKIITRPNRPRPAISMNGPGVP